MKLIGGANLIVKLLHNEAGVISRRIVSQQNCLEVASNSRKQNLQKHFDAALISGVAEGPHAFLRTNAFPAHVHTRRTGKKSTQHIRDVLGVHVQKRFYIIENKETLLRL